MMSRLAESAPSEWLLTLETNGWGGVSSPSLIEADKARSILSTHVYD